MSKKYASIVVVLCIAILWFAVCLHFYAVIKNLAILDFTVIYNSYRGPVDVESFRKSVESMLATHELELKKFALKLFGVWLAFVFLIVFLIARNLKFFNEMQLFLGSLDVGVFTFEDKGSMSRIHSQVLKSYFPDIDTFNNFRDFLKIYSIEKYVNQFDYFLELTWADSSDGFFSDFNSNVTFLPKRIHRSTDGRVREFSLQYLPIYRKGKIFAISVHVSDSTQHNWQRESFIEQKNRVDRITKVANDISGFTVFTREAIEIIRKIDLSLFSMQIDAQVLRNLHTLKGMLSLNSFDAEADLIHQIEDILVLKDQQNLPKIWAEFKNLWQSNIYDLEHVLGLRQFKSKEFISKKNLDSLLRYIDLKNSSDDVKIKVKDLQRFPIWEVMDRYTSYVRSLNEQNREKKVDLIFDETSAEFSFDEIAELDNAFIHIIRNCFDHGIESTLEREQSGKDSIGIVRISAFRTKLNKRLVIIADDGRGIDLTRLRQKVVDSHLLSEKAAVAMIDREIIQYIFHPGLSTKEKADSLSGRGIGMDAVLHLVNTKGGRIEVVTKKGLGTQFKIEV